jgi:crossover junction endodeoxyribonuclease RuvC
MKTILGIDPGLKYTGFGVICLKNNLVQYISHGIISTDPAQERADRLAYIHKSIIKLIKQYGPEEAGIEDIFFAKNIKTAFPVAEVKGVILCALSLMHIETSVYTPLEVKRGVVGNGRAEKEQVQELVRIILKLKEIPEPNHAADALAVAICHAHNSNIKNLYSQKR